MAHYGDAGPCGDITPPGQVQEKTQRQASAHRTSVVKSQAVRADFPEAPLSVAALLARMQKLKSTK